MPTPERIVIESMFQIVDKQQNTVPFRLNAAQKSLDNRLTGRDVVPKARQKGISSYQLGRYTAKCLSQQNVRAVVISHEKEATERMLAKVHFYLEHLAGGLPAILENSSKMEITFPKTNSMFYIGTAGQRAFGRGDTITHLHCSEVAYWPDTKKLMTGLLNAVPSTGEVCIESTGNGQGNWYHNLCMRAAANRSRYRLHFIPWTVDSEYSHHLSNEEAEAVMGNLLEEYEEPDLVKQYNITAGQISWRREQLEAVDYDLRSFKQEYPISLAECFQSTGHSIFQKINYIETADWKKIDSQLQQLDGHPIAGRIYSIGVDVAAGVGKDRSVIEVVDTVAQEQVAEWVSDRLAPDTFAAHVISVGKAFNEAYLTVESNNHGLVTLKALQGLYPANKINRSVAAGKRTDEVGRLVDLGIRTTARSKPYIIGKCRKILASGAPIHSVNLKAELDSFVEHEDGSLSATDGCFDDRVMAYALALYGTDRAVIFGGVQEKAGIEVVDPFHLESIIKELGKRRSGFPFKSQVM